MKLKAAQLISAGRTLTNQILTIQNGLITAIAPTQADEPADLTLHPDHILIPGMIDLHIHGAHGFDVMDGTTTALTEISTSLAREGVTGFLATTMTESTARIEQALDNIVTCKKNHLDETGAEILGVHLEGPFLSKAFMGAQCEAYLRTPDAHLLTAWQTRAEGLIKIITLAPELPQAETLIQSALALNITVSAGHTAASMQQTLQAIDQGITHATHLFNAMSGIHHRTPGAAAALLIDSRVTAELIIDGLHLSPDMVRFIFASKDLAQLVLVSDAMSAKCLKNGEYTFGGQDVILQDGVARVKKNGALAGSTLALNQALKNAQLYTGLGLEKLLPLVTEIPARILKMDQQLGRIQPNYKANLTVLDRNLEVVLTLREGRILYSRGHPD